ncbi:MAG: thioredoxin family protein [Myxococcota bacterium]
MRAWLVGAFVLASCGSAKQEAPARFDAGADPAMTVAAAVERTKGTSKSVVIEVGGDWCSDTRALDAIFESDPTVSRLLDEHFELVRVHRSADIPNDDYLARYPSFGGVPHLFLLDAEGKLVASVSGEAMVRQEPRGEANERTAKLLGAWSKLGR